VTDLGLLILRMAVAAVFIVHGYFKVLGGHFDRTVALFLTVNIPAAELMAWVVGLTELIGGVLVTVGWWARPAAGLLAADMLVAIARVRLSQGFLGGWEFELTLLSACLAVMIAGTGRYAAGAPRARLRSDPREDSTA
jgi:putative oxidoreductase